ncbi:hypothetical protein [Bradyrhizobium sp. Ash2021]|uniref:hypothetical protein n=1 Tax=Bradyrhizobium sp. Ash2021 TaxID=2954771 RepID=UPI002815764B|nr:hypothetical protein [Bradyrhizobium sp. Ash2021]WMT70918.1 hypothetical protein NL528_22625 [Bradyrhizobium sp. Ash2021]
MEYRGKQYLIFEGDEPNSWRWAVTLDDLTTKTGETKSRGEAITQIVLLIDGSLSGATKHPGRTNDA